MKITVSSPDQPVLPGHFFAAHIQPTERFGLTHGYTLQALQVTKSLEETVIVTTCGLTLHCCPFTQLIGPIPA